MTAALPPDPPGHASLDAPTGPLGFDAEPRADVGGGPTERMATVLAFDPGAHDLDDEVRAELMIVASLYFVDTAHSRVRVVGRGTDAASPRQGELLARKRTQAVLDYLGRLGLPAHAVLAVAIGSDGTDLSGPRAAAVDVRLYTWTG